MLPSQLLQTFGISDLFLDLLSCESQKSKLHDKRDKRDKRTVPKVVATSVARCYPVRVIPSPPEAFARWDSPAKRHAASSRCQTLNDRASTWNKHQTVTNELILKESHGYSMLDHWFSLARIVCTILHLSGNWNRFRAKLNTPSTCTCMLGWRGLFDNLRLGFLSKDQKKIAKPYVKVI